MIGSDDSNILSSQYLNKAKVAAPDDSYFYIAGELYVKSLEDAQTLYNDAAATIILGERADTDSIAISNLNNIKNTIQELKITEE